MSTLLSTSGKPERGGEKHQVRRDLLFVLHLDQISNHHLVFFLFTTKGYNWKYLRTLHYDKLAISDHTNLDIRLKFKFHCNF